MSDETNWTRELTAYIDGELSEAERAALEAQLARDPRLRAAEARLRQTVALMKKVPAPTVSASLKSSVLERLEAGTSSASAPSVFAWRRAVPLLAVAAAALVAVLVRGRVGEQVPAIVEDDQLLIAQVMEDVEDLDLAGLTSPEDLEVIEQLKELEACP